MYPAVIGEIFDVAIFAAGDKAGRRQISVAIGTLHLYRVEVPEAAKSAAIWAVVERRKTHDRHVA